VKTTFGLSKRSLRWWLGGFFVVLALPSAVLVRQATSQLKWEAFHSHQQLASELAARVDGELIRWINTEQARSFSDYEFLVVTGAGGFLAPSPLSAYPVPAAIPGLMGYFQIAADGGFSTPLLPDSVDQAGNYGISATEMGQRQALGDSLLSVLGENALVSARARAPILAADSRLADDAGKAGFDRPVASPQALSIEVAEEAVRETEPAPEMTAQAAFDRLNQPEQQAAPARKSEAKLGRVEDLKLDSSYLDEDDAFSRPQDSLSNQKLLEQRAGRRKEQNLAAEASPPRVDESLARQLSPPRVRTFESDIDPFEFNRLDSGHFVLFRKVWRDEKRIIQGALIEPQALVSGVFEQAFADSSLASMSDLAVAHGGEVFQLLPGGGADRYLSSADDFIGELLYRTAMTAPLSDFEMIFSINSLPVGPGGQVISWMAAALTLLLIGGLIGMYRLGLKQIDLIAQQQDFVSSVSHELKTPLTSIRMYGEMLREGWAPDEKKQVYYDYIFDESERLSRLIANVLQLARMNRNELVLDIAQIPVGELVTALEDKIGSLVERAGFELLLDTDEASAGVSVQVDRDAFIQIAINLVDNALKFARNAEPRRIELGARIRDRRFCFTVRDFGPGVARSQMKKIFRLFYRPQSELTRETVGTGIGLALVQQLTAAMQGQVDVVNRQPGAEFRVLLPVLNAAVAPTNRIPSPADPE
jgi:signal transduction histidine kinase